MSSTGGKYLCYILRCENYTYNGCTNNFKRRIRQHNGEIKGGAKCTALRGPWEHYCIITGFQDQREALQAEWRIKRVEGRRRPRKYCGVEGRIKGLSAIFKLEQFTSKSARKLADMSLVVYLANDFHHLLADLPENIVLRDMDDADLSKINE